MNNQKPYEGRVKNIFSSPSKKIQTCWLWYIFLSNFEHKHQHSSQSNVNILTLLRCFTSMSLNTTCSRFIQVLLNLPLYRKSMFMKRFRLLRFYIGNASIRFFAYVWEGLKKTLNLLSWIYIKRYYTHVHLNLR